MTEFIRQNIAIHLVSNTADISPVVKEDGSIDQAALAEYQEFLINIFAVLDEHELEVLDDETGHKSESFYCITAFKRSAAKVLCYQFSIHLFGRYSPDAFEKAKLKQSFYQKQTWRLENVTVNGEEFDSYDGALEGIGRLLTY